MAIYSNLPTVDKDVAVKFFEQYFSKGASVTENEVNAVVAYFDARTTNKEVANAMAIAVLHGAYEQSLTPMQVLDQFKSMDTKQLDSYLAYFLNLTRYPTSLLGLTNTPRAGRYVKRSILP